MQPCDEPSSPSACLRTTSSILMPTGYGHRLMHMTPDTLFSLTSAQALLAELTGYSCDWTRPILRAVLRVA